MNSCLYECSVMHHRLAPKAHHFQHDIFMFYLDLDELEIVAQELHVLEGGELVRLRERQAQLLALRRDLLRALRGER